MTNTTTPIYGVIYFIAVGFLFINTLINPAAEDQFGNQLLIIGAIAIIMVCPVMVDRMYRAGLMQRGSRLLMVVAYVFTILVLGFSAISWYLAPDNSRWEPLTIILGFTSSWISLLQQGWRPEDRILSIINFGGGDA